jgi:hypothetical protein
MDVRIVTGETATDSFKAHNILNNYKRVAKFTNVAYY